jgi:DNA-binding beta-propeller fold protein YncE/tetratricopeptide (TPR) repeat protein
MASLGAAFLLAIGSVSTFAETGNGFLKADFKKEIATPKLEKLLGVSGTVLLVSKQEGALEAVGDDGKVTLTYPAKAGDETLLKQPEAIAIEGDTLYVVDSGSQQVVMYSLTTAKYLGKFGGKSGGLFGGDDNMLKSPQGIAVSEGVVYVADTDNARIQLFGVNGVFMHTFEVSSPTAAAESKEIPYLLKEPTSIALDSVGRVYVLDAGDSQVKIYEPSGRYLKSLPGVGKPMALSVAEDGIYVADEVSQVISKFDLEGKLTYIFGSKGEARAQFKKLAGLAVEKGQQVYVGDTGKSWVNHFLTVAGNKPEPLAKVPGRASVKWMGNFAIEAQVLASDAKGSVLAISKEGKSLLKLVEGKVVAEIKPVDMELVAVTVDKNGAIWVLDKKKKRCVQLDETGKVLSSFGSVGSGAGQFGNPVALAVNSAGLIFVADSSNHNVQMFRGDGVYLNNLGGTNSAISSPTALAFDPLGNFFVLDASRRSVLVYSATGDFIQELGKQKEVSVFNKPLGLVVTADELLVLDGSQVKAFTHKGELLRVFGTSTTGAGDMPDPVGIITAGGSSLLVSDRKSKSIRQFAVLYKPEKVKTLTAHNKVHAIELRWDLPAVAYVKEFRIYRSKTEQGGYVQLATTAANTYVDAGLDADARYYYRVAAVSDFSYEGAISEGASAVADKFMPKSLAEIKAETTPWQVKLSWEAADPQYFAAYRVYQKEGEAFVKLGEIMQAEYSRDALLPETKYSYFVSVLSTDGTESEKKMVEATTLVFNRPPLEIEVLKLNDIFSNSYKLYEKSGLGSIKLTNNTEKPMEKIRISFMLKNFMDFATENKIAKLLPGQSEELLLKAVFNNSILTVTEDSAVQAEIEASYFEDGKRVAYSRIATVNVYDKHRLTWDDRDRFATFVTPKDPPVINMARAVVGEYKETKDEARLAAALFDALGVYGVTYIQDPSNPYQVSSEKTNTVDYIQFPRETLERKSGDCDDLVAFYSSGLESMGINTRVLEVPGHMLMMFSTGIAAEPDGYNMNNLYVIYEDMLWIPVETTLVGNSFINAWEKGSATYYKFKDKGLTILDVHRGWEKYKPASLPDSEWKPTGLTRAAIDKKFPGDNMSVLKISSQVRTRRYLEGLKLNPSDVDANLQLGIIMAKLGDHDEAMKYFDKVISLDSKHAGAMNNRGNLFMIGDKYPEAQKAYLAASQASPKDAQIWVNLARAYTRTGETKKAKAAFVKAQGIDSKVKEQYRALGLELLNAM